MAKNKTVAKKSKNSKSEKSAPLKAKGKAIVRAKKAASKPAKAAAKKGGKKPITNTAKPAKKASPKKAVKAKSTPKTPTVKKKQATKIVKPKAALVPKKAAPVKSPVVKKAAKKVEPSSKKSISASKPAAKPTVAKKNAEKAPVKKVVAKPAKTKAAPPALDKYKDDELPTVIKKTLKQRVQMEFYIRSAPTVLYELISTPSGFSEWYCTDVDVNEDQYTFKWEGEEEEATTLIGRKLGEVIRFHRNDDEDPDAFFEFRIRIDAMTNDVALIVTDHGWPKEIASIKNLWSTQIHELMRVLGA